jgi:hypothetical protein
MIVAWPALVDWQPPWLKPVILVVWLTYCLFGVYTARNQQ